VPVIALPKELQVHPEWFGVGRSPVLGSVSPSSSDTLCGTYGTDLDIFGSSHSDNLWPPEYRRSRRVIRIGPCSLVGPFCRRAYPVVGVTRTSAPDGGVIRRLRSPKLKCETEENTDMSERIIVLRTEQPQRVLVDVCSALADAINEPHAWRTTDTELLTVYAEAVSSLARLRRAQLAGRPGTEVPVAIIDHLLDRLRQTQAGEIEMPLADVVDRLHAEAIRDLVTA